MQRAVEAQQTANGTDTIRWKLVHRTWGSIMYDHYCPSPDPASPECPDVVNMGTTQFAWAWDHDLLVPLDKYFSNYFRKTGHSIRDDMVKYSIYDYYTADAKPMAIPYNVDVRVLAINRTVFDLHNLPYPPPYNMDYWGDPPTKWTWDTVVEFARNITEPGKPGFHFRSMYDEEDKFLASISRDVTYNAFLLKEDGKEASWNQPLADKCGWDSPGFRHLLNNVIRQMWIVDKSGNMDFVPLDALQPYLNATGGIPMADPIKRPGLVTSEWHGKQYHGITWAGSNDILGSIKDFDPRYSELAAVYAPQHSFLGGTGLVIMRTSSDPDMAWAFLEQMLAKDVLDLTGDVTGIPPPFDSIVQQPKWENKSIYSTLAGQLKQSTPMQYPDLMFPQMSDFENLHPGRHLMIEMVYMNLTVDQAIERACYAINYVFTPRCIAYGSPKTDETCPNYCDLLRNATELVSLNSLMKLQNEHKSGVIITLIYFLLVVIATGATALFIIRNEIIGTRARMEEKGGSREVNLTLWQARPTMANYIAVAAMIGDWIQYSAVQIMLTPEWAGSFASGISWIGLVFNVLWFYCAIYYVLIPVWILYTAIFRTGAAAKLAAIDRPWARALLYPSVNALLFCGTFGFIPMIQALMKVGDCRYGPGGLAILDMKCTVTCWQAAHHAMTAVAYGFLLFFIPMQLLQAHIWQELQDALDIKGDPIHIVISLVVKVTHAMVLHFFVDTVWGSLIFLFIVNVSVTAYVYKCRTYNIVWTTQLTQILNCMTVGSSVAAVVTHGVGEAGWSDAAQRVGIVLMAVWWIAGLSWFVWQMRCKYPLSMFISNESADATAKLVQMLPKFGNKKDQGKENDKSPSFRLAKSCQFPPETMKVGARRRNHY
ncbi:hypothetical protein HK104_011327 [Borealophlyctis nickersoniae]|nr:hypothetical protein HK104_011327 [Borealophlyctis nickersoniae]